MMSSLQCIYSIQYIVLLLLLLLLTIQYNTTKYNTIQYNTMYFSTMYERGYFRICYNVDNEDMHGLPTLSTSFQWC